MAGNYKNIMKKLDDQIRSNPSTPEQTRYLDFTIKNKGYEFVHRRSGKVYTKLQLFFKYYHADRKKINLLEEDSHPDFLRRIKKGWKIKVLGSGTEIAVREDGK